MDIKQLRYFLGVLDAKSFTKAAKTLHVAQPAIGMQIRNLEEELGVKLLVRHSRGIEPTATGLMLEKRARSLLQFHEEMRQEILDTVGEPRGQVSVGMTETVTHVLASRLLDVCRSKYPKIGLRFSEGMSERLSEWVSEARMDIVLTYNPPSDSNLISEPMAVESLYFAIPAGQAVNGPTITLREALEHDLVLTSHMSLFREIVENAARQHQLSPRVVCEADSPAMIKALVRSGVGCSIVPYGGVLPEIESKKIRAVRIVEPELERTLYLTYSKKRMTLRAINAVLDEVRAIAREISLAGFVGWSPPTPVAGQQAPGKPGKAKVAGR